MNRTIKFRAYDKERREYLSGGNIFIGIEPGKRPASSKQYLDIIQDPNKYANRFLIEQFTGLYDSKGKEVFEGDILCVNPTKYGRGYVKWHSKMAQFVVNMVCTEQWYSIADGVAEVCGNIHDNPELLRGETE